MGEIWLVVLNLSSGFSFLSDENGVAQEYDSEDEAYAAVEGHIAEIAATAIRWPPHRAPAQSDGERIEGWRPIETAPKDNVILLSDGILSYVGYWNDSGADGDRRFPWVLYDRDTDSGVNGLMCRDATDWMPLPTPPIHGTEGE